MLETPQAVRVVPQQLIEDLGAAAWPTRWTLSAASLRLNDFGGTWDNFAIRGSSNTDGGSLLTQFCVGPGLWPAAT